MLCFQEIKCTNTENIANFAYLNFLTSFTIVNLLSTLRYLLSQSAHSNLKLEYKFLSSISLDCFFTSYYHDEMRQAFVLFKKLKHYMWHLSTKGSISRKSRSRVNGLLRSNVKVDLKIFFLQILILTFTTFCLWKNYSWTEVASLYFSVH